MEIKQNLLIPADVPESKHETFTKNYNAITRETGRLFLFSCDHKIEHLNRDFYGETISPQTLHPEHIFRIASQGNIGALATHLGIITRYAKQYPDINYIVKINAATHFIPTFSTEDGHIKEHDPKSYILWNVDDVVHFKNNNSSLSVPGIGITVYLGNDYESEHLAQAAQAIMHAHSEGLVAIVWMYMRGKAAINENDPELITGAAGIGLSLGADFIKIKEPNATDFFTSNQSLKIASAAAGNSKILCAGGEKIEQEKYLQNLYDQIHTGDTFGTATGRNIFQLSLPESIALTHAISAIVYENADYNTARTIYNGKIEKKLP